VHALHSVFTESAKRRKEWKKPIKGGMSTKKTALQNWREARRTRGWELHEQGWKQKDIAQALHDMIKLTKELASLLGISLEEVV
jgi:transposase